MWSYYGSKSRIVKFYPKPKHGTIIEPFAGSARYALKYFENDVLLIDKYPKVINIWKYLQQCSQKDIMSLPSLPAYSKIKREDFDCDEAFELMTFLIVQGAYRGNYTVSKWGAMRFEKNRSNIINSLHKIKHWKIVLGEYFDAPDMTATWFVDPPYQFGGHKYPMGSKKIDYVHLKGWIESRNGQAIACENTKATWMDFNILRKQTGVKFTTTEAIWTNEKSDFDITQIKLLI